jgi:hypothetical protein
MWSRVAAIALMGLGLVGATSGAERTSFRGLSLGQNWEQVSEILADLGWHCLGAEELSLFYEASDLVARLDARAECLAFPNAADLASMPSHLQQALPQLQPSHIGAATIVFHRGEAVRLWLPLSFLAETKRDLEEILAGRDIHSLLSELQSRYAMVSSFAWDGLRHVNETLNSEFVAVYVKESGQPDFIEVRASGLSPS